MSNQAEITYFDLPFMVEQEVGGLDVAVDLTVLVEESQAFEDFSGDVC
jgi:hypothetical protein